MPTVGSLFAGVGGFDMGLERAGFEVKWQVEIDKDAVSVLERHYPNTHRVRDVREAGAHNLIPVDVITFGSPCQGFSVAGRGEGLEDARSGLFAEAVRIIRELRPAVAFWENVPGAYSANDGRDFGAVLAALADAGALDIAWRVLDARWFGVPQRRRRIFLVADFGAERAASVLFESEGSRRDSAACREAGEGAPGDAEDGAGVPSLAFTVRASDDGGHDNWWNSTYIPELSNTPRLAHTLRTSGYGNGTGCERGDGADNLIPVTGDGVAHAVTCHAAKGGDPSTDNYVFAPLTAGSHPNSNMPGRRREDDENLVPVISLNWQHVATDWSEEVSQCLSTSRVPAVSGHAVPVAPWDDLQATCPGYRGTVEYGAPAHTLHTAGQSIVTPMAVRRLTPRECERLMGWPDDWTRYRANGDEISDGPRYRMIGNGVVSNVSEWIGRRLMRALTAGPALPGAGGGR